MRKPAFAALLLFSAVMPFSSTLAAQARGWLGTWTAADFEMPQDAAAELRQRTHLGAEPVTLRQVVRLTQGGKMLRVRFSNEFGTAPLTISAAHVAFLASGSKILPGTDLTLLFNGQPSVTIPAGGFTASDALTVRVPIFSDLVISTALPAQPMPAITFHALALQTAFFAAGDQTAVAEFGSQMLRPPGVTLPGATAPVRALAGDNPEAKAIRVNRQPAQNPAPPAADAPPALLAQVDSWFFLKDVEVDAVKKSAALVCLGDSITDGARSTTETDRRYPDVLEGLAAQATKTMYLSVLNAGIGGNRLLQDGAGQKASSRFERDVLSQPGVRFVLLIEGINDIGGSHGAVTAQQIIAAQTALADRAHAKGLKIYGGTLTPFEGAGYYNPAGELARQQVNNFLRSNTVFDGVVDFDNAIRDPAQPGRISPKYDSGDHLHPSDAGYAAMGAAVPLKLLQLK